MFATDLPPLIYLASKYTEKHSYLIQRNIDRARLCAQEVALAGACPITPPLLGPHFEGIQDYLWWGDAYMNLLRRCDAVFMVPGYERSNGAMKELTEALRLKMPVFYRMSELMDWLDTGFATVVDPNYVPPSPEALAKLHAGIESVKSGQIVFRDENFSQYADDE